VCWERYSEGNSGGNIDGKPLLYKKYDLIISLAYTLMQAAEKFQHPTTHINKMWQTDLTYCKIIGWGLRYAQIYQSFTKEAAGIRSVF
jgi:hypothetical protein